MEKIENAYRHGDYTIITNYPEIYTDKIIKGIFGSRGSYLINCDDDLKNAIEAFKNYPRIEEGYYTYNDSVIHLKEISEHERWVRCFDKSRPIFLYSHINSSSYSSVSSIDGFTFISKDKQEAIRKLDEINEEKNMKDFVSRLYSQNNNQFYEKATSFVINYCLDLIEETGDIEKYTLNGTLDQVKIFRGISTIPKKEFKDRLKTVKDKGLLAMF